MELLQQAGKAAIDAGYTDALIKIREHSGCRNRAPAYPAYSVWLKQPGASRGRAFMTIICPDFRLA